MSKLPFIQFFPADWLRDTRCLSLEARGAWIDLLCLLWESKTRGQISWPLSAFDQFLGTIERDQLIYSASEIFEELSKLGIAEVVTDNNGIVTLICRRMLREENQRNQGRERQTRYRGRGGNGQNDELSRRIYQKSEIRSHIREDEPQAADPVDNLPKVKEGEEPWRPIAGRIFATDKQKFLQLVVWIKAGLKKYGDHNLIAQVLTSFEPHASKIADWYPYLQKILVKEARNKSERAAIAEHERIKSDERHWLLAVEKDGLRGLARELSKEIGRA